MTIFHAVPESSKHRRNSKRNTMPLCSRDLTNPESAACGFWGSVQEQHERSVYTSFPNGGRPASQ